MRKSEINSIVVCGAGTMGSGIAQVAASAGYHTILYDVAPGMLQKAEAAIDSSLSYLVKKQKIQPGDITAIKARITFTSSILACKGDVVIEAIVEKMQAKVDLLMQISSINHSDCILATNTSSLSVNDLQQQLPQPNRVAGMHFFNPAPVMKLVEIVKGDATDDHVVALLYHLAEQMGKTPVHCLDAPGFIVNHVARPYYLTALRLLENNTASAETIDAALEAAGFKMGAFRLMDLIGIDINLKASEEVWAGLGNPERLKPSALQRLLVEQGKLGRKTNQGFYSY